MINNKYKYRKYKAKLNILLNQLGGDFITAELKYDGPIIDESHILSHYFINSSHNTSMINQQIIGDASYCGFTHHLNLIGTGCLEVDITDAVIDTNGNPEVYVSHEFVSGKTMNFIRLSDSLKIIRKWIEKNYDKLIGPLILSFDNKSIREKYKHDIIWRVLENELFHSKYGNRNWYYPLDKKIIDGDNITLKDLKGKILIKWDQCFARNSKNECMHTTDVNKIDQLHTTYKPDVSIDDPTETNNSRNFDEVDKIDKYVGGPTVGIFAPLDEKDDGGQVKKGHPIGIDPPPNREIYNFIPTKTKGIMEYDIKLLKVPLKNKQESYLRWVHFNRTKYPITTEFLLKEVQGEMKSYAFSPFKKLVKNENIVNKLIYNTQRNFVRVFPDASNVKSDNYDQTMAWKSGCQMAAFNIQKQDRYWFINNEFFKGKSFRLKPDWLLTDNLTNTAHIFNLILQIDIKIKKLKVFSQDGYYQKELTGYQKDGGFEWLIENLDVTVPIIYFEIEIGDKRYRAAKEFPYDSQIKLGDVNYIPVILYYYERDKYGEKYGERETKLRENFSVCYATSKTKLPSVIINPIVINKLEEFEYENRDDSPISINMKYTWKEASEKTLSNIMQ